MGTAWWWTPGGQWWLAARRDQASALPESTSVTYDSCANTCLCSSTAGLTSTAVWVSPHPKTFDFVSCCCGNVGAGPGCGPSLTLRTLAQLLGKGETHLSSHFTFRKVEFYIVTVYFMKTEIMLRGEHYWH